MKNQILGTAFLATALSLVGCDTEEKTSSASDNISNNINGVLDGYYLDDNYNGDGYLNNYNNNYNGYNDGYVIDPYYKDYNESNGYSYSYPNSYSYSDAENYKYKNYTDNSYTYDDDNYNNYEGFVDKNYDMLYNGDGDKYSNSTTNYSSTTNSTNSTTSTASTSEEPTTITTNNASINNSYHTNYSLENYSERFGWGMKGAENISGNETRDYTMMDVIKN